MTQISICVLDDHPVIAEGVRRVIENTPDIVFRGAATTGAELYDLLSAHPIDIAIFDLRLAGEETVPLCMSVKRRYPNLKILMLSSFFDRMVVQKSIAAGASGYALKRMSMDMLPAAIRQVYAGGIYLSSEIAAEALLLAGTEHASKLLNTRDEKIVQLVGQGQSNKEIAIALGISHHTVKLHVSRLLKKFSYRKRSQLTLLVRGDPSAERHHPG